MYISEAKAWEVGSRIPSKNPVLFCWCQCCSTEACVPCWSNKDAFYTAMEWLQETGGGDWWAQILAGSQRCPEDDRPGGMIHHAFLPNNSVQMKIIQYWLLLIDWTISVIFYILITIVRGDRKSLHVQHFLEPTVMDLEKSWNFTTGGWCTLMYPCALSGCLFQQ